MLSSEEHPFSVSVPNPEPDFLKKQLQPARFLDELKGAGCHYGVPCEAACEHQQNSVDWRKSQGILKSLPMFLCNVRSTSKGLGSPKATTSS